MFITTLLCCYPARDQLCWTGFQARQRRGGRGAEEFYRERWRHDKEVRSTHGVNCTGSCSRKVFVKDGIITWETQQTGYPSIGPDSPGYEPRGCPREASFSWYTYSPTRVRYRYVRGRCGRYDQEARRPLRRNRYEACGRCREWTGRFERRI